MWDRLENEMLHLNRPHSKLTEIEMKLLVSRGQRPLGGGSTWGSESWGPAWRSWAEWRRRDRRRGEQAGRAGSSCPAAAAAGGYQRSPALEPGTGRWVRPEGGTDAVSVSGHMEAVGVRQGQLDFLCWSHHTEKSKFSPTLNNKVILHSFYIIYIIRWQETVTVHFNHTVNLLYIYPWLYTTYVVYGAYIQ